MMLDAAPVIGIEWNDPNPPCRTAVDAAVAMQGKGDIGFFEMWSEGGPLGNPLQKRMGALVVVGGGGWVCSSLFLWWDGGRVQCHVRVL
jgi:hypothetical protein